MTQIEKKAEEKHLEWGRVLICGGTNWATNGRKDRAPSTSADLLEPQLLRSLCNIRVVKLLTGPAASYSIVIDIHGAAWLFGRVPVSTVKGAIQGVISHHVPFKIAASSVGAPRETKWVTGAVARSHCLLVDDRGVVFGFGSNTFGQLGFTRLQDVETFTRVQGPWMKDTDVKVVAVSVGNTFSLFLTDSGQVYASGSSEAGQLGNGKTGERLLKAGKTGFDLEIAPRLVQGLANKKIAQIASGNQHSLAMDEEGFVYAWGYGGYSRLGLGDQKDRLSPMLIPQFAGGNEATRAQQIVCGPSSEYIFRPAEWWLISQDSVVVSRQGMYYMAGKWKVTGDGSSGQPYTTFKPMQDIMGCKILKASCGGSSHFVTTPADGGVMTVAFGQGVLYGELGLGKDEGKSATKPVEIMPLQGVDVIDVAGGAYHTLFLAKPNDALEGLIRHPELPNQDSDAFCLGCGKADEAGEQLACEKCEQGYHIECLDPPLDQWPEGEWFCPDCTVEQEAGPEEAFISSMEPNGRASKPFRNSSKGAKRKFEDEASTQGLAKKKR